MNEAAAELRDARNLQILGTHDTSLRDGDDALRHGDHVVRTDLAARILLHAVDDVVLVRQDARGDGQDFQFSLHSSPLLNRLQASRRQATRLPAHAPGSSPSNTSKDAFPFPDR